MNFTKNPSVAGISRQGNIITIKKKDGTTEKYDTSKKEEDKSFTEKYGVSPILPPPPPPKKIERIAIKQIKNLLKFTRGFLLILLIIQQSFHHNRRYGLHSDY